MRISVGQPHKSVVLATQPRGHTRGPQQVLETACLDFKGSDSRRCCACRVYKDQDDEGGASSPERSQLVDRQFKYKRVMLKISGEALEGAHEFGIDPTVLQRIAREVAEVSRSGVEVAIVVGGGNFFRGVNRWKGLDRPTADYVGMLATIMNAITLQSAIESEGVETRVQTSIEMREVAEPYIRRRAIRHLERGRVVIFGGGTGNPFFTTDTASALRAAEIGADVFLKATQVDGIYDSDPKKNGNARRYSHLSYRKCVVDNLKVLDETAFTLCKENLIPVVVFNLHTEGNILSAARGCTTACTVVDGDPDCPEDCLSPALSATHTAVATPASPEMLSLLENIPAAEAQEV